MKYRLILLTKLGGLETLRIVENELRSPAARDVRVRVLTAAVSLPDVEVPNVA